MTRRRRLLALYARLGRTYRAWAPVLIGLALVVFLPLGLIDALLNEVDPSALDVSGGVRVAAFVAAVGAVAASGLLGQVLFSGAVAISLTHPEHEGPPSLHHIAGHISYTRLVVVDIVYSIGVAVGLLLLVVPGLAALIYFALAGPVVELEDHTVSGSFRRSFRLVRGHFWMVASLVLPVEILGDAVNDAIVAASHALLGDGILAAWVGESLGNVITAPFFAVAIVLLTLDLIHHRDGASPTLKRRPAPIPAPAAA